MMLTNTEMAAMRELFDRMAGTGRLLNHTVEYGYPKLTRETKRKILAENAARVYHVDLKKLSPRVGRSRRDLGRGIVKRTSMGQKTVRFSDLSEQLITDDSDLVRIVVHEHPDLDGQAVEIEAHLDEVGAITDAALQVAVVELYLPGESEPRRVILDAAVLDKLASSRPMEELLIAARPARRAPKPRAATRAGTAADAASGGERVDYGTLAHAGKPHKGRITDTEKKLVREHLAEVNARLAAEGLRTIDPADPALAERYGLEGDAATPG